MRSALNIFLITLFSIHLDLSSASCDKKWSDTVLVSVLLPIHSGENCSRVELRSLQQLAAIKDAIEEVNIDNKMQDGFTLSVQVHDTCGTTEGAVKAAMHALVDSQQTCLDPPLYLGMLGPEDSSSISAVKKVTNVFNISHILPHPVELPKESLDGSVLFVTMQQHKEQSQTILTVIHEMQWQRISLVYDEPNSALAKVFVQLTKLNPMICVINAIVIHSDLPQLASDVDGIVFLIDGPEMAANVLEEYDDLNTPILMSINEIGLRSWEVPRRTAESIILQQTSISVKSLRDEINSTLLSEYEKQNLHAFKKVHCTGTHATVDCLEDYSEDKDLFSDSIDASVTPWSHAVRLMASGLRVTHRVLCRNAGSEIATLGLCKRLMNIHPNEWRTFLTRAFAFTKYGEHTASTRLRFNMEMSTSFDIYFQDSLNTNLEKIGRIKNGKALSISPGYSLPSLVYNNNLSDLKCSSGDLQTTIETQPEQPDVVTISDIIFSQSDYALYELIGMLCGAAVCMVGIMACMIYIVYKSFKVKSNRSSGKSSPSGSPRRSVRGRNSSVRNT